MTLALEAPERLEKLVLCNTAPKIGTLEFWNTRIETVETKGMREVAQAVTARWFTLAFQNHRPKSLSAIRILESLDPRATREAALPFATSISARMSIKSSRQLWCFPVHTIRRPLLPMAACSPKISRRTLYRTQYSHLSNIEDPAEFQPSGSVVSHD
jgi:pimeloyl-ACP methyl ester carboxylesterase